MKYQDFINAVSEKAREQGHFFVQDALSRIVFDDRVSTMATNATNIFVNPKWIDHLTTDEIVGVLCHELMHDIYKHDKARWAVYDRASKISQSQWHTLCNVAMDVVINDVILSLGLQLPKEGVFRKDLDIPANMHTSHAIFKKLLADLQAKRNEQALQQAMQQMTQEQQDNDTVKSDTNQTPSSNGYPKGSPQAAKSKKNKKQNSNQDSVDDSDSQDEQDGADGQGSSSQSDDQSSQSGGSSQSDSDSENSDENNSGSSTSDAQEQLDKEKEELEKAIQEHNKKKEELEKKKQQRQEELDNQNNEESDGDSGSQNEEDSTIDDELQQEEEELNKEAEQLQQQADDLKKRQEELDNQNNEESDGDSDNDSDSNSGDSTDSTDDDSSDDESEDTSDSNSTDTDDNADATDDNGSNSDDDSDTDEEGATDSDNTSSGDDSDTDDGSESDPDDSSDTEDDSDSDDGGSSDDTSDTDEGSVGDQDDDLSDDSDEAGDSSTTSNGVGGSDDRTLDDVRQAMKEIFDSEISDTLYQEEKAPVVHKPVLPPKQSWVDITFQWAGKYLANSERQRTFQRPSRRPSWGFPDSDLKTPFKGSRTGDYKPRAWFYIDVSGSMYYTSRMQFIDRPNLIREELLRHIHILRDTQSLVVPFASSLYQPIDVTMTIPRLGGGTSIEKVIAHINQNKNKFDIFVIVTDCDTTFSTDDIDSKKQVVIVTNQIDEVRGSARPNLKVIGVDEF